MNQEIILGIDPGFGRIGWGVIARDARREWRPIACGCIETPIRGDFPERLGEIDRELNRIIKKYKPTRMAVEDLFFFRNVTTAIKVGQARGVILLAAVKNNIPVDEFTPLQIKRAITGYGKAEKGQMQKMVAAILRVPKIKSDDAADALAAALTAGASLWKKRLKK